MLQDKFHVGLRLSLQMSKAYERIDMSLVGWINRVVIFATGPNLRETQLTSEDHCVIRFMNNGIAYGFHTRMVNKLYAPIPLIFFRYPEHINSMAFRKSPRVRTSIPAKIMGVRGTSDVICDNAIIADLSETGCLLKVGSTELPEIEPSKDFYLTFTLWGESLELDCTVRNIRKNEGHYLLGVEFKRVPKICEESIQHFHGMLDVDQRELQH